MTAKFVVFDTETTGLFLFRDPDTGASVPADDPRQPRMCSFAAILADERGHPIDSFHHFVRPDGWSIAAYDALAIAAGKTPASAINGFTDAFLTERGIPVADVLDRWTGFIDDGLVVVAFNAQFDCKMMRAELRRAGRHDRFDDTRNICVMRSLHPYGPEGLPIVRGFIKLALACEHFGIVNTKAHDAMGDAEAARNLLELLIRDGRLPEARVHRAAA